MFVIYLSNDSKRTLEKTNHHTELKYDFYGWKRKEQDTGTGEAMKQVCQVTCWCEFKINSWHNQTASSKPHQL
jgi:hypothetical protein